MFEYKVDFQMSKVCDISFSYYSGWISLHRKIMNKAFFKKPNYLAIWIYLLLNANHSEAEIIWNQEKRIIKRGELITSQKGISEFFKISIGTVNRILKYFKMENQIEIQSNNLFTYISIINYDEYQTNGNQNGKPDETKMKSKEKQNETNNKDNKVNNENNENNNIGKHVFQKPTKEEILSYIQENNYFVDNEKFYDFYESKGWMVGKNKMKDWRAAVRTWQKSSIKTEKSIGNEKTYDPNTHVLSSKWD